MAKFQKGAPRPPNGGRRKGMPNKVSADLKAMVMGALSDQPGGGQKYLADQATANPAAFMGLLGKCLPKDVNATHTVKHDPAELTDAELADIIQRGLPAVDG